MITKSDYTEWLNHPVTIAFKEACEHRIEDAKEILAHYSDPPNPDQDSFYRGFIYAYREIKQFDVEDEE